MKALILITLTIVTTATIATGQTIWLVDNSPNKPAGTHVLSSIQAAHDSATAGDIIHIKPSETSYGNLLITKSINIFGIGFNPDKDIPKLSILDNIYFNQGSSDSRISGLYVISINLANAPNASFSISNIQIDNCNIHYITDDECCSNKSVDNLLIRNNLIGNENTYGSRSVLEFGDANVTISNAIISNNIFKDAAATNYGAIDGNGLLVKNNLFYGENTGAYEAFDALTNSTVSNNIFYGCTPLANSTTSFEANVFNNNLTYLTTADSLPPVGTGNGNSGSNNMQSVNPMFTNLPLSAKFLFSYDLTLQTGSPALNAGTDGTDIGPSGGTTPWDQTGVSLPLIKTILANDVVKQGDNLNVEIKAEGNN